MQSSDADQLRELVAQLTGLGSRVIWDGDQRVRSIAMFGEDIADRDLALLREVPGLRHLNLTRTRISDAGLFHVSKLPALEILLLGGTDITDEGFEMLESLAELQQLNLTNTGITDRGLRSIGQFAKLEALWLDSTEVTDLTLELLAESTSLQLLDLRKTEVTDCGLSHLRGLELLEELNLAGCQQITGRGLAELAGLRRLEWLGLDATGIDDDALRHLVGLPLKCLSLNWTGLGDAALGWLERIAPLSDLHMLGTRISSAQIERFRASRPGCVVHHCP
jgi:hypothetical protein